MNVEIGKKYTGSISSLVPLYIKNIKIGYIHSIFKDSLNIRFGENLVYISGLQKSLISFGCRILDEKIKKIVKKVRIGDIVVKKEKKLVFYTNLGLEEVNLPLGREKELHIPFMGNTEKIKKIFEEIKENLEKLDFKKNIGIEHNLKWNKKIDNSRKNSGEKQENGQNTNEIEKILAGGLTEEAQKYLTGRGKGLTPSGDDILVGYSFICRLCGEDTRLLYGESTTDISRQYFDAFNRGYVSEDLLDILEGNVKEAIRKISEVGHTSGYDILFGIFLGVKNKLQKMEEII